MSNTPETDATANPLWGDAQELCLLRELARKLERERDEARNALRLIADDCEAWLAGESDEPSMEFIKLVAKYAREASK